MKLNSKLYREMEKHFPKVEKLFSEKLMARFLQTPASRLRGYNFGLGTMIRLKLLRPQNILYKKFIKHGLTDTEEMTMKIIVEFHHYISQKGPTA